MGGRLLSSPHPPVSPPPTCCLSPPGLPRRLPNPVAPEGVSGMSLPSDNPATSLEVGFEGSRGPNPLRAFVSGAGHVPVRARPRGGSGASQNVRRGGGGLPWGRSPAVASRRRPWTISPVVSLLLLAHRPSPGASPCPPSLGLLLRPALSFSPSPVCPCPLVPSFPSEPLFRPRQRERWPGRGCGEGPGGGGKEKGRPGAGGLYLPCFEDMGVVVWRWRWGLVRRSAGARLVPCSGR